MKYDPDIHHRRSVRLKGYDYSQAGIYFITICTQNRECLLGEIINEAMKLSQFGSIAQQQWFEIEKRFPDIELDEFVVMPNHIHGILIHKFVGAPLAGAQNANDKIQTTVKGAPVLGSVIGGYKSLVIHHCLQHIKDSDSKIALGKFWQRNYHEHIIRNEASLEKIREYVVNNPINWPVDELNPGDREGRPYARGKM
jgi:REP element-mobilizing transposase RayT